MRIVHILAMFILVVPEAYADEKKLIEDIVGALKPLLEIKKGNNEDSNAVLKREQLEDQRLNKFMEVVEAKSKMTGDDALTLANVQKVLDALVPLLDDVEFKYDTTRFLFLRRWLRDRVQLIDIKTNKYVGIPKTVKEKIEFFDNYFKGKKTVSDVRITLENPALTAFCVGFALLAHRPDVLNMAEKEMGEISWVDVPAADIARSMTRAAKAVEGASGGGADNYLWKHVFGYFFHAYKDELSKDQPVESAGMGGSILKEFSKEVEQLQKEGKIKKDTAKLVAENTLETMLAESEKPVDLKVGAKDIVSFEDAMGKAVEVVVEEQKQKKVQRQQYELEQKQKAALAQLTASLKALL